MGGAFGASRYATPRFEGRVSKLVVFTIPSVGSMDVLPALSRVIQSILTFAPLHLDRFRIDVVVDEGSEGIPTLLRTFGGDSINLVTVPSGFRCRNGGAKNKARALEYARIVREREGGLARDDVFIYHLDDDTAVGGADTIKSIAQFISEDDGVSYHLAQGVLSFPYDLSKSWIARVADSIRPSDDLTRFHFFTGILGRPLAGLHGEHLLVRSSVENRIGWDFGVNRLEDSYFGLVFSQLYPGKSKFLNSFVYGGLASNDLRLHKTEEALVLRFPAACILEQAEAQGQDTHGALHNILRCESFPVCGHSGCGLHAVRCPGCA